MMTGAEAYARTALIRRSATLGLPRPPDLFVVIRTVLRVIAVTTPVEIPARHAVRETSATPQPDFFAAPRIATIRPAGITDVTSLVALAAAGMFAPRSAVRRLFLIAAVTWIAASSRDIAERSAAGLFARAPIPERFAARASRARPAAMGHATQVKPALHVRRTISAAYADKEIYSEEPLMVMNKSTNLMRLLPWLRAAGYIPAEPFSIVLGEIRLFGSAWLPRLIFSSGEQTWARA